MVLDDVDSDSESVLQLRIPDGNPRGRWGLHDGTKGVFDIAYEWCRFVSLLYNNHQEIVSLLL